MGPAGDVASARECLRLSCLLHDVSTDSMYMPNTLSTPLVPNTSTPFDSVGLFAAALILVCFCLTLKLALVGYTHASKLFHSCGLKQIYTTDLDNSEMCVCAWVQDPVDNSPAVLVHRYSITHQRRAQILLSERNEVLQK